MKAPSVVIAATAMEAGADCSIAYPLKLSCCRIVIRAAGAFHRSLAAGMQRTRTPFDMLLNMKKVRGREELRVVSLAPSATAILCAVGARAALVGVTKWCAEGAGVRGRA